MELKIAISNIAWSEADDDAVYSFLRERKISAIEIAPTRIFTKEPYHDLERVKRYREYLKEEYGLGICSLQSIWYGRSERIFGSMEERQILIDYTKQAILFAESIGAKNLVFGCPKNRNIDDWFYEGVALSFFRDLGDFATNHNTVVAMEANPKIYGTNYINTTSDAIKLVNKVGSEGFKLNLDFGTIIANCEDLNFICDNINLVNHVHISEPYLNKIISRPEHKILMSALAQNNYSGYISIEMKKQEYLDDVFDTIKYLENIVE